MLCERSSSASGGEAVFGDKLRLVRNPATRWPGFDGIEKGGI